MHECYLGVEGDCWNIDEDTEGLNKQEIDNIRDYVYRNIESSWYDEQAIDGCNSIKFLNKYLDACINAQINFLVLYCKTNRTMPSYRQVDTTDNFRFLGYDYAYPGGSFYSCVFNDLYSRRIYELHNIELNEYGLISSEEMLIQFVERRNELVKYDQNSLFEQGHFVTYELWQYIGEYPIYLD